MLRRHEHDSIVSALYAAAAGDLSWGEAVGKLADTFGMEAGVLAVANPEQTSYRAECHGRDPDFANSYYGSEAFVNDPRTPYFLSTQPGTLYFDHCLYDVGAMLRHPRVRETVELIGVTYQLGATLRLQGNSLGMLALLSTERQGHASETDVRAFRRIAPHIEQACLLGELIERAAATQSALLEAMAVKADGFILLTSRGEIAFANDAARTILAHGDGLRWEPRGFVTRRGPETRKLAQMVMDAITVSLGGAPSVRPGGQMLLSRPSGLKPLVVRVLPAPAVERFLATQSIGCVIHLHDLAAVRLPSRELLQGAFGLTRRESDLAIELFRHVGLAAAALAAGMAFNTARNHLHSIFRKCGVSGQTEAVQLFSRLA